MPLTLDKHTSRQRREEVWGPWEGGYYNQQPGAMAITQCVYRGDGAPVSLVLSGVGYTSANVFRDPWGLTHLSLLLQAFSGRHPTWHRGYFFLFCDSSVFCLCSYYILIIFKCSFQCCVDKILLAYIYCSYQFSVQFSGIKYTHIAARRSDHLQNALPLAKLKLYPLDSHFSLPLSSAPSNHNSTFCLYDFDYSRCLMYGITHY